VLLFNQGAERVRDFEPAFVIDSGGVISPEHDSLLHFVPQKSTAIVEKGSWDVNRKIMQALGLRFIFALEQRAKDAVRLGEAC
jgi:hypothetical protein